MAERKDSLPGACKDFEQDLVLYHYQDCSGAERQRVESHLDSCASCRGFLQELRSLLPATVESDEPSAAFWQNYSREMRVKLAAQEEKSGWWPAISSFFRPWPVPAVATALILALAVTLTFTRGRWFPVKSEDPEVLEMASNADFFKSLDFLDSMDLLEAVEGTEAQTSETSPRPL
ncbi:MAG TPA: zf-HC2 domain-containing protein [Candidatus Binatia bacterium]|jgi:hypothetical protein